MRTRGPTHRDVFATPWDGKNGLAGPYAAACTRTLRDAVLAMIEEPGITRRQLRGRIIAVAKLIETWGPDAPYPAVRFYDLPEDEPGPVAAPAHWEWLHLRQHSGESSESYARRLAEVAPKVEEYWAEANKAASPHP